MLLDRPEVVDRLVDRVLEALAGRLVLNGEVLGPEGVGLSRLPGNCRKRSIVSLRYEKQVTGHHVQVDVKFLQSRGDDGRLRKRYQFTAIDDATRIRALRIYERHNQQSAVDIIDYVVERFPFRIHTVHTERAREAGAVPLARRGPRHAARLHQTGQAEPERQGRALAPHRPARVLPTARLHRDVDLRAKLAVWEEFYNLQRPHAAHGGRTPYEVLREKLLS